MEQPYIDYDELAKKVVDELEQRGLTQRKAPKESNRIIAELSMPNIGSWNGKWTGSERKHTVLVGTGKGYAKLIGDYYYDFGDGWGASVEIRKAAPREKVTNMFCGYEWMIDSIKQHGGIRDPSKKKE